MTNAGGTHGGAAARPAAAKSASGPAPDSIAKPAKKTSGYGLPCSKCHLYYPANLDSCPTCHARERIAPVPPKFPPKSAAKSAEPVPPKPATDHEQEEFLKQFKAGSRWTPADAAHTPGVACKFQELHPGDSAKAEICSICYERLQERLDALEGALHIDLTEAAQIVYDAVWANPSEPSKTYENAANALLNELRSRAAGGKVGS